MKARYYLVMTYASLISLVLLMMASMVVDNFLLMIASETCLIGIMFFAFTYVKKVCEEQIPSLRKETTSQ